MRLIDVPEGRLGRRTERGASTVEYGLVAAAIAAVLTIVVVALGGVTLDLFGRSCTTIESTTATTATCSP